VCSTRKDLIVIDQSANTTIFTTSLNAAYDTWTSSYQTQFKGYKKRVEVIIWSSTSTMTVSNKLTNISLVLGNYASPTDDREITLKAVQLGQWGTVKQFCACDGN